MINLSSMLIKLYTLIGDFRWATTPPKTKAKQIREVLKLNLNPGDVLARKYDYFLDSYLLPGNPYTHSALYIGDNKIVESVAEGVVLTDIIDFIVNTDAFIILRPEYNHTQNEYKATQFALSQLGKEYDCLFSDKDKWYCHEIVARSLMEGGVHIQPIARKYGIWPLKFTKIIYMYEDFVQHCATVYEFNE